MLTLPQAVAPPAPYEVLKPGAVTKDRDIKRLNVSDQWEGAGINDIDKVIKESDEHEYARAKAPPGYALLGENKTPVLPGDLCFQKNVGEWKTFEDLYESQDEGKTIGELARKAGRGNWLWFARLLRNEFDSPVVNEQASFSIPEGYRLMDVGETRRYGDKCKELNAEEWFSVDSIARGMPVPERNTKDGCYIYIRPVSPLHRYWYINRESGCDENGDGSLAAPWKSAQHAMARIEKGESVFGHKLFGSILGLPGMEGVQHFDVDEPEAEPLPVKFNSEPVEPPQSRRYETVADISKFDGGLFRDFEKVKSGRYPKHWRKQDVHRYVGRLKDKFPTFRVMYQGESLKQGDLICKKIDGKRTWVPCPIEMVGTEVDYMPELCARDSLPSRKLESFEAKLDAMSHKLYEAIDYLSLLKADYAKLRLM